MLKPYLQNLVNYNLWANERTSSWILSAGDTIADLPQVSSFPSIRKTVYHVWDAQVIWLARLNGSSLNSWPSQNFKGSTSEALQAFLENSRGFVRFVEENDENALESIIRYTAIDGTAYASKASEILQHVVNHGSYHRGQLVTLLRNAGFENVGSTDLIRYYRTL